MQKVGSTLRYSASDLVNFASCRHLTRLDLVNLETPLPKAKDSEEMVLIQEKGFAHEAKYWEHLKAENARVADLSSAGTNDDERFASTKKALADGSAIVFQATLLSAPWVGHADFLIRVDKPSALGDYSYEVSDTKLARSSRAKFLLQLCLYSEMLAEVQGVMPVHMHVVLGDGRKDTFLVADYLRYFRRLKARFLDWVLLENPESYPEKVEQCRQCRWRDICAARWEQDDHLNRVANISKTQIVRLRAAGVHTLNQLAGVSFEQGVPRMQPETLQRLAHQARLQQQSECTGQPVFELLPLRDSKGFARLHQPATGDLFFDMEGDPMTEGGLEYLFGLYFFEDGKPIFKTFWAHDRRQEQQSFEAFIDFVTAHLRAYPGAHIYHYAPYEATALKRLMSLHGTRETQVDDLLRQAKLVDLYAVVREAIRVGESSYSIKAIERFYSSKQRDGDVKTAGASVVFYEKWKTSGDPSILQAIADYNEDDVRSTYELRQWLLSIRPVGLPWYGQTTAEAEVEESAKAPTEAALAAAETMEQFRVQLLDGLPSDRLTWSSEDQLKELLFYLLGFHRRLEKPAWWALFARKDASEDELLEDLEAIAGLIPTREPEDEEDHVRYWYRFPEQETKLKTGDNCTLTFNLEEVFDLEVDEDRREVTFCRGCEAAFRDPMPAQGVGLGAGRPINVNVIVGAVRRFVSEYLAGQGKFAAGLALLRREFPRVAGVVAGQPLLFPGEDLVGGCIRVVSGLKDSCLFIQGPPGAGKTYTGSHVIVESTSPRI